ncbi:MAG TPA: dihydroorotate dehydrogenase [Candidatus Saccharimonadales bacterium]|nr:dihydroorotate dehydrogenase [Candidatus Saccharimonadales bacterium]
MSKKNPNSTAEAAGKVPKQVEGKAAIDSRPAAADAAPSASKRGPLTLDMSVNVAGLQLKNPILAASGTFGYGVEFEDIVSLERLGGFVVKGLSREPMAGNPPPRLFETAAGMLNAIGLQNIGARAFIEEKLPRLVKIKDAVVIANVYGYSTDEYQQTIRILNEGEGIAAYELNVSCPNVRHGGITFGQDASLLADVVTAARAVSRRPLIVKLSPNVTDIAKMARTAEDAGADAVSLVNTFLAMAIDPVTRRPRISNVTAGLSGPAIKPIAVRMVYEVAQAVKIPVIGMGGISTPEDVVEFLLAGATAVEVGTANFWDPRACERLVKQLERWCLEQHIESVAGLRGGLVLG